MQIRAKILKLISTKQESVTNNGCSLYKNK
jgi:hypothetical protein